MPAPADLLTVLGSGAISVGVVGALLKWAVPRAARAEAEAIITARLATLDARLSAAEAMHGDLRVIATKLDHVTERVDRQTTAMEGIGQAVTDALVTLAGVEARHASATAATPKRRRRT